MNKIIAVVLVAVLLAGCAQQKTICGTTYDSYGLLNQDDKKNPNIQYEIVWGNVVWSAVLIETIIFPIYFFGFSIFQPVGMKSGVKGAVGEPTDCKALQQHL